MDAPEILISVVDGVWAKQMHFVKAGDVMYGHKHLHNHMTLLAKGSVSVTVEGEATTFIAPHIIFITKGDEHSLTALEDNTIAYCIHANREFETGNIVDPTMMPKRSGFGPNGLEPLAME